MFSNVSDLFVSFCDAKLIIICEFYVREAKLFINKAGLFIIPLSWEFEHFQELSD